MSNPLPFSIRNLMFQECLMGKTPEFLIWYCVRPKDLENVSETSTYEGLQVFQNLFFFQVSHAKRRTDSLSITLGIYFNPWWYNNTVSSWHLDQSASYAHDVQNTTYTATCGYWDRKHLLSDALKQVVEISCV
jgi:hypothetical protein